MTRDSIKDSLQVGAANGGAITFELTECNEVLTFISLTLAIIFTVIKIVKYLRNDKKKKIK